MSDAKHVIGKIEFGPTPATHVGSSGIVSDSFSRLENENSRLLEALGQISRMRCNPDKTIVLATLAAAIQIAKKAVGEEI